MRAYYATYNDKVYQLLCNNMIPSDIMNTVLSTHSEVSHMKDRGSVNVKLTISNLDSSAPSNKEVFDSIVSKLKADKTTQIDRLSDVYRIYTEYSLVDEISGRVVDEGVGINEVKSRAFIFPLGITPENEYVSRLGISIKSKINKEYRDVRPFGIMKVPTNSRFVLYIKRIYILQLTMNAFSIKECTKDSNPFPYIKDPDSCIPYDLHSRPYCNCGMDFNNVGYMNHPSIPTVVTAQTINLRDDDYIMMYDTLEDGIVFGPITIDYKPTSISIDIDFAFLDILIAAEEDIDRVLEENKKEEIPVIPPSSDTDKEDNENADNLNTGNEGVTDPYTKTGTETDSTNTGDDEQTTTP